MTVRPRTVARIPRMAALVFSDADQAVGNLVGAVRGRQQSRETLLVANALINLGYAPVIAVRVACTPAIEAANAARVAAS